MSDPSSWTRLLGTILGVYASRLYATPTGDLGPRESCTARSQLRGNCSPDYLGAWSPTGHRPSQEACNERGMANWNLPKGGGTGIAWFVVSLCSSMRSNGTWTARTFAEGRSGSYDVT